jgi:hypothetical protein
MGRTRSDLTFSGRRAYDKAQSERKDRLAEGNSDATPPQRTGLIVDGDILKVQGDDLRGTLMARTSERHTEDDIKKNKPHQTGMTDGPAPETIYAVPNETPSEQTPEEAQIEAVFTDEIIAPTPKDITSQEYKEKKHQAVGRLAKILEDDRIKKIGRSWRALALVTLVTIGGGKLIGDAIGSSETPITSSPRAKTLGEAVSWQDHLNPSQKEFLGDLAGPKKLSFLELTKKYAYPFYIHTENPSTIKHYYDMEANILLNSEGDKYGIRNENDRTGLSNLASMLAKIIQASDVNNRYVPNLQEKPSKEELKAIIPEKMTMEQLYQVAIQAATQANSK